MWGSTFADLAKKAQELQEQAKEQASHLHVPNAAGFFNLDAMRDDETSNTQDVFSTPHPSQHIVHQEAMMTPKKTVELSGMGMKLEATMPKKPVVKLGKLETPQKKVAPKKTTPPARVAKLLAADNDAMWDDWDDAVTTKPKKTQSHAVAAPAAVQQKFNAAAAAVAPTRTLDSTRNVSSALRLDVSSAHIPSSVKTNAADDAQESAAIGQQQPDRHAEEKLKSLDAGAEQDLQSATGWSQDELDVEDEPVAEEASNGKVENATTKDEPVVKQEESEQEKVDKSLDAGVPDLPSAESGTGWSQDDLDVEDEAVVEEPSNENVENVMTKDEPAIVKVEESEQEKVDESLDDGAEQDLPSAEGGKGWSEDQFDVEDEPAAEEPSSVDAENSKTEDELAINVDESEALQQEVDDGAEHDLQENDASFENAPNVDIDEQENEIASQEPFIAVSSDAAVEESHELPEVKGVESSLISDHEPASIEQPASPRDEAAVSSNIDDGMVAGDEDVGTQENDLDAAQSKDEDQDAISAEKVAAEEESSVLGPESPNIADASHSISSPEQSPSKANESIDSAKDTVEGPVQESTSPPESTSFTIDEHPEDTADSIPVEPPSGVNESDVGVAFEPAKEEPTFADRGFSLLANINGESSNADEPSGPLSWSMPTLWSEQDINTALESQGAAPDEVASATDNLDTVTADETEKEESSSLVKHMATTSSASAPSVNDTVEIQRLKEAHRSELVDLERQYEKRLQAARSSSNHKQCEAERQEMEQRFMTQILAKQEQMQKVLRENEGYKLRIDALKREVTGTQELLQQRDNAMGDVNAFHHKNVENLEQKVKDMEKEAAVAKSDAEKLKEALQSTKNELGASNEAYATLKSRVKVVATELKERRVECRTLSSSVKELHETNEQLGTQIENYQSQLADREKGRSEIDREMKKLREQIEGLELELHKTEIALKERDAVGEKALSAYKKKAQNALAVANSRAAAANQAKEEAEIEAIEARTMAEDAVRRASVAEASGHEALAEAKAYVRDMEKEKASLEKTASEAIAALKASTAESEHLKNSLEASRAAQDKLAEDLKNIIHDRNEERARSVDLQQKLDEAQRRSDLLYEEAETLREELRRAAAAPVSPVEKEKESWAGWPHQAAGASSDGATERSDGVEGTIAMLESELRDANRAIRELKEALKNAILDQGSNGHGHHIETSSTYAAHPPSEMQRSGSAGNESTPLFFAMEKQAELNTARDEINRLANLLGDAESSRMEAYEAMDEMRRRMEAAEAKLLRYEKFGSRPPAAQQQRPTSPLHDANGNVNLEYLKNVMLSYLNAKTLTEKKALVPVVAAVLCLTPEEQAKALKSVEESGGLEGVGMALFENFGSHVRR